jgi:hypothetical protein
VGRKADSDVRLFVGSEDAQQFRDQMNGGGIQDGSNSQSNFGFQELA